MVLDKHSVRKKKRMFLLWRKKYLWISCLKKKKINKIITSPCSSSLPCAELRCLPSQVRPGRTGQYPAQTENMMFYIPKSRNCSPLCQLHWSNNYSDLLNTCRGGKDSPNAEVQIRFTVAQIKETRGSHISILGCSLRIQEFSKGNLKKK